jgi:amidase
MPELSFSTVIQQAEWVASGAVTARQLVAHSLERIEQLNPVLNAFHFVLATEAIAAADVLDAERSSGTLRGPLHGVPIAVKAENDIAGVPTTFGTGANLTPAKTDSEVVARLRAAGAIILGSTRMPEFGLWPYTESVSGGWTRNPWNPRYSACGSSGGTASGMVAAGIGGDGGGSIRLPASWCGLFGLKAQRGRVSTTPSRDLWRSLGVIGPITRTVADSALLYDVISGPGRDDRFHAAPLSTSMSDAVRGINSAPDGLPRLRIAVSAANPAGEPGPNRATRDALSKTVVALRELGHEVSQFDPKYPRVSLPFILQVAAGASDEVANLDEPSKLEKRTRDLLRLTKPLRGLSRGAEREATRKGHAFLRDLFAEYDLLITPVTATEAEPVGQLDGLSAIRTVLKATPVASYTSIWNVFGNPAASVPMGFTAAGLPLAVQVVGPNNGEPEVLKLCAQLEQHVPWAHRHPTL